MKHTENVPVVLKSFQGRVKAESGEALNLELWMDRKGGAAIVASFPDPRDRRVFRFDCDAVNALYDGVAMKGRCTVTAMPYREAGETRTRFKFKIFGLRERDGSLKDGEKDLEFFLPSERVEGLLKAVKALRVAVRRCGKYLIYSPAPAPSKDNGGGDKGKSKPEPKPAPSKDEDGAKCAAPAEAEAPAQA